MRRAPGGRFVAALAVLLASSCGDAPEGSGGEGGTTFSSRAFCDPALARVDSFLATLPDTVRGERYGGTAVAGGIGELVDGMNGLVSQEYAANQHQVFVNLMTLVRYDEELRPVPYLAESWEISGDGTELTFRLRDDVRWHDGERTDAYDVRFTFLRATDPATGFPNATYFRFYEAGPEGVEVLDSLTVRFRLRPHGEILDPWRSTAILPEHLLGDVPPEELRRHPYGTVCPVGNGPFVFREHRQDASWTFEANPAFPEGLGGRPYLDRYVYRVVPEQTTLLAELLAGSVDLYIQARPDQARRIVEADGVELKRFPFRQYTFVGWNGRRPELADARVRRAITLATNRREIVDAILEGYGRLANTPVPPFHWAYDPSFEDALPHDPDEARRLLDEAGWRDRDGDGVRESADGAPLSISIQYNTGNEQRQQIAEIMQSQLAKVGIEVLPRGLEFATLVERVTDPERREFDGVILAWVVDFRLDDHDLFHSRAGDEAFGFAGLDVPEVDRLLDTLPLITERVEARPHWSAYQRLMVEHQPYTFLYFPDQLDGVRTRVRNVRMDARGDWSGIHGWWIPPSERRYAGDTGGG